jgi:alanine racemase
MVDIGSKPRDNREDDVMLVKAPLMPDTSQLHINLSALDRNMGVLRRIVGPECALCPIVKADAYGMGAARIAPRLAAAGAELLAVYTPEQAAGLVRAAVSVPVLILMPVSDIARTDELYRWLVSERLHLTVHDEAHLEQLLRLAERFACTIPVHLEIDTGMSRGGADPAAAMAMIRRIAATRWMRLAGVMTHFSNARADAERTAAQLAVFDRVIEESKGAVPADCMIHVASTYSLLRHRRYHRSMVRFGLAWAGYGLEEIEGGEIIVEGERLQPAVSWTSRMVQTKTLAPGQCVGYGSLWSATRRSVLGLVPVGYADGYPVRMNGGQEGVHGGQVGVMLDGGAVGYAPVVGAVNMDQITIDLTDIVAVPGGPGASVGVGTTVELISTDRDAPNALCRVAKAAGTIPHEMLCRINPRIRRVYEVESSLVETSSRTAIAAG